MEESSTIRRQLITRHSIILSHKWEAGLLDLNRMWMPPYTLYLLLGASQSLKDINLDPVTTEVLKVQRPTEAAQNAWQRIPTKGWRKGRGVKLSRQPDSKKGWWFNFVHILKKPKSQKDAYIYTTTCQKATKLALTNGLHGWSKTTFCCSPRVKLMATKYKSLDLSFPLANEIYPGLLKDSLS